ncbi:Alpha-1,2-fucosyltransferase [Chrysochromulina ericina virus CeV-01B]|uniref:Alpha-1,2-fucosyltransferase n=1 Tax=Chrysochromulina ericina virus CeV-01B TaxID=3070830 RepID=A0A0N9R2S4_9VIRU|nr:glycosyltransferase [Chrysochromulina ericina virus]ALH22915.1 Alpha-1,2-fucosyltransferase [Chrysochromulina ericina virus CeV-01B]
MIYIQLKGGLGNQLFQIFSGISYALENNIEFKIIKPKSDYVSPLDNKSLRPTYWHNFLCNLSNYTCKNINILTYNEPSFTYNKIPNINKNFKINGYFQSPKYFENYYKSIIELIGLDKQKTEIREKYKEYLNNKIISLHFRIGDYAKKPEYHLILDIQYYIDALKIILEKDNNCDTVLYFNEKQDNNIVENMINNIKKSYPQLNFIQSSNSMQDWEQLLLMSLCKHNITANSSFSWWGAYFNSNKEKIVCYPSVWFGPKCNNSTKDLFPKNWIKV